METTAVKTAREVVAKSGAGVQGQQVQLDAPRFFVQIGWDALQVDTNAVPNRYFLRGEITPVRSYQCRTNINEIREGEKIAGSEEADESGRIVWAKYWRHAYYEAERLVDNENNASHKSGLVEIKSLAGMPNLYDEVDFNALFFPGFPALPEKNEDLLAALRQQVATLETSPANNIPAHLRTIVLSVGKELIAAVVTAQAVQHGRLQYTHSCMKLKPGDEGYKREYDAVDREMLLRTDVPEIHAAEVQTAQTLKVLSEKAVPQADANAGLLAIVEEMRAAREQQSEIIKMLMADRESAKVEKSQPKTR